MSAPSIIGIILFLLSFGSIATFIAYPILVWGASRFSSGKQLTSENPATTKVTLLVVVRNGENIIEAKIANSLALKYPSDDIQLLFVSDGSTDRTVELLQSQKENAIETIALEKHAGKIAAMNYAIEHCRGDIIIFSDADAILAPDALNLILPHFQDPEVGGVCGQRIICDNSNWGSQGQSTYIGMDSKIKLLETRLGSITSNDGKLYAIRRTLYQPLPEAVTDDLFVCLTVVRQKQRFIFEPKAVANIHLPSRSKTHEFQRRRRIVSTSLRGIYFNRILLNPCTYGWYTPQLFINKIMRRLLPFYAIGMMLGCALIAIEFALLRFPLLLALAGIVFALIWPVGLRFPRPLRKLGHAIDTANYFCLGNIGMLFGVVDCLCGKCITTWEPNKGRSAEAT